MVVKEEVLSSLIPCSRPPILIGDDTPIAIAGEGRVELPNGSFENVLHVPNLFINILSVYQITQKGKKVEFILVSITVLNMHEVGRAPSTFSCPPSLAWIGKKTTLYFPQWLGGPEFTDRSVHNTIHAVHYQT
jgi:hypothetical protein